MTWESANHIVHASASAGLLAAGQFLLTESTRVAPIESDALIASAAVGMLTALEVAVSYDEPYAVKQHEDLSERHDPGRQGKYLEGPLYANAQRMLGIIAADMRRRI